MDVIVLGLMLLSLTIWLGLLCFWGQFWRLDQQLEIGETPLKSLPVVCAVVPALDTPRDKSMGILGSTKPLNIESLRHLDQRWDSSQALTFRVPLGSCIAASPILLETICSKILSRLAPMNLLPTARRKLEQCSRTA
jgi:hypothetical protein